MALGVPCRPRSAWAAPAECGWTYAVNSLPVATMPGLGGGGGQPCATWFWSMVRMLGLGGGGGQPCATWFWFMVRMLGLGGGGGQPCATISGGADTMPGRGGGGGQPCACWRSVLGVGLLLTIGGLNCSISVTRTPTQSSMQTRLIGWYLPEREVATRFQFLRSRSESVQDSEQQGVIHTT